MYFSEDGDGVDRRAVPAPVGELLLALLDGDGGAGLDRVHHVDVLPTDLLLFLDEPEQSVALVLGSDVIDRSR